MIFPLNRKNTGWEIHQSQFRFNRFQYDPGEKEFLGRRGAFDGDEGVDVVLAQEAVAPFIVRKILRHLVGDEPEFPDLLVTPLADQFRSSGYEIGRLVGTILESRLFFSDHALGHKIRSPVELAVGWLRCLKGSTNMQQLAEQLGQIGQMLFFPPHVKGWPGGRAWLNSATIVGRAKARPAVFWGWDCGGVTVRAGLHCGTKGRGAHFGVQLAAAAAPR